MSSRTDGSMPTGVDLPPGIKLVNDLWWPITDVDSMAVTFTEVRNLDHALAHCKQMRIAIQAGGNAGVWPLYLAKHFERVHTFEPEPMTFKCLAHNVMNTPNVFAHHAALGASNSGTRLEYPEGARNMGAVCIGRGDGAIKMVRLDSFLDLDAVDLIQLDIEGYEPNVIVGATKVIKHCKPVIMVEDKGLSVRYGMPANWSVEDLSKHFNYTMAGKVENDVIFIPREA
jgi:FkbM family methyltransferase